MTRLGVLALTVAVAALLVLASGARQEASASGWRCDGWKGHRLCRVTPQYFRYRPPSLRARCWSSQFGPSTCPYAEKPLWYRGCWLNRYGRVVCQNLL